MRVAYADPPYLGSAHHYKDLHEEAHAWNDPETHRALVERLVDQFDAWAMSLHSPSLRTILPMCPPHVRVMAWVKPFASFKPGVNPAYAWEPIIVHAPKRRNREVATARDWVAVNITLKRGLVGAKPEALCHWLFTVLGAEPTDDFVDLFPGSGAVGEAWQSYCEGWTPYPRQLDTLLDAFA